MERKQIPSGSVYDRLPLLSANYPWLVAQNLEAEDDGEQIFYTLQDPMFHYRCRIPELLGKRIRGCFHGWVILSNHPHGDKWCLWNPIASKCIFLPRLIMKDGDSDDIVDCCLSSPPDDPGSIILLTRKTKPNFVFCRLDCKRKKLRWIEMSYFKQLWNMVGVENASLLGLSCCNGKVYSLIVPSCEIVHVQIVVKNKEVVISLCPFVSTPDDYYAVGSCSNIFLKGSSQELFAIMVGFSYLTKEKPVDVSLFKLDVTTMVWTKMKELKGMVFFVDMNRDMSVTSAIASEFGGYIHIFHKTDKLIYSYNVNDKSISMSYMHCLDLSPSSRSGGLRTNHISVWTMPGEFRLQGDHGEVRCKANSKHDEMVVSSVRNDEVEFSSKTNESQLLNIPFHVLEMIIEFCIGIEYLNFRATCKRCHLAAPVIEWSYEERLQTYSLSSPWMMRFEKDEGIITFTDPMFGDKYFITASEELFYEKRILCSRYGWLLLFIDAQLLVFFNPFTRDMLELPDVIHLQCFCFSAPPTSPDCTVVGFLTERLEETTTIYVHYVGGEASWRIIHLDLHSVFFMFPTFCGRDVYVLSNEGGLHVFKDNDSSFETVVAEPPRSCCRVSTEYFLVKCDQHVLLLVIVGDFGESVEVFKLKDDSSTKEWEKMDDLGRHVIYICGTTCLCMDAKTPEMENKIFFPLLHLKNEKTVFYSLETRKYQTFNGRNGNEDLKDVFETKHKFSTHAWIEPSWLELA